MARGLPPFPRCQQMYDKKLQRRLILGVNRKGILLLLPADGVSTNAMKVIAEHSLNDIYRWAYKPGVNFYFEVKPEDEDDDNPLYMFSTVEVRGGGRLCVCGCGCVGVGVKGMEGLVAEHHACSKAAPHTRCVLRRIAPSALAGPFVAPRAHPHTPFWCCHPPGQVHRGLADGLRDGPAA